MRTTFDYKGIEIIAMGDEEEIARFIKRLVGNEPKKELEKKQRKKPVYQDKNCITCKTDFTPRYSLQKICDKCGKEEPKIPKEEKKPINEVKFREKRCLVCKNDFTPHAGAQMRCNDCIKEGLKIPKEERKHAEKQIKPPDRKCFGKNYEHSSAFCSYSCVVREKCKKAFEGTGGC